MIFGVDFHDAYNCILTIGGEFSIRKDGNIERYQFSVGSNVWIKKYTNGKWINVPTDGSRFQEDIVNILGDQPGIKWDYRAFLVAVSFFEEGQKKGSNLNK